MPIAGIAILIPALIIMLVAVLLIVIADELFTRKIRYIIYNKWNSQFIRSELITLGRKVKSNKA